MDTYGKLRATRIRSVALLAERAGKPAETADPMWTIDELLDWVERRRLERMKREGDL